MKPMCVNSTNITLTCSNHQKQDLGSSIIMKEIKKKIKKIGQFESLKRDNT